MYVRLYRRRNRSTSQNSFQEEGLSLENKSKNQFLGNMETYILNTTEAILEIIKTNEIPESVEFAIKYWNLTDRSSPLFDLEYTK